MFETRQTTAPMASHRSGLILSAIHGQSIAKKVQIHRRPRTLLQWRAHRLLIYSPCFADGRGWSAALELTLVATLFDVVRKPSKVFNISRANFVDVPAFRGPHFKVPMETSGQLQSCRVQRSRPLHVVELVEVQCVVLMSGHQPILQSVR